VKFYRKHPGTNAADFMDLAKLLEVTEVRAPTD